MSPLLELPHGRKNVVSLERDVLHACTLILFKIGLNLGTMERRRVRETESREGDPIKPGRDFSP